MIADILKLITSQDTICPFLQNLMIVINAREHKGKKVFFIYVYGTKL